MDNLINNRVTEQKNYCHDPDAGKGKRKVIKEDSKKEVKGL